MSCSITGRFGFFSRGSRTPWSGVSFNSRRPSFVRSLVAQFSAVSRITRSDSIARSRTTFPRRNSRERADSLPSGENKTLRIRFGECVHVARATEECHDSLERAFIGFLSTGLFACKRRALLVQVY